MSIDEVMAIAAEYRNAPTFAGRCEAKVALRAAIEQHVAEAVARERQRCANILASVSRSNPMSAQDCLDIIRAGAEKETR